MTDKKVTLGGIFAEGYGIVPKLMLKAQDICSNSKLILCYLLSYTGSGATAFPNMDDMAIDLNLSKRTIIRCIKEVFEQEYLHIDKKYLGRGKGSSNFYTLLFMGDYPHLKKDASDNIASAKKARASQSNGHAKKSTKTLLDTTRGNRNINILKETLNKNNISLPTHLGTNEVYQCILDYYEDREERKNKMTLRALKLFVGKVAKFTTADIAISAINESIERGWGSVFLSQESKFKNGGKQHTWQEKVFLSAIEPFKERNKYEQKHLDWLLTNYLPDIDLKDFEAHPDRYIAEINDKLKTGGLR